MAGFRSRESKYLADFRNTTELFAVDERLRDSSEVTTASDKVAIRSLTSGSLTEQ